MTEYVKSSNSEVVGSDDDSESIADIPPVCIDIHDKDGTRKVELDERGEKVNIYMLPFIKPIEVKQYFYDEKIETYNDAMKLIMSKEEIHQDEVNILMAHQFVTGGTSQPETSDSETVTRAAMIVDAC